jgi:hypothetical protein
VSLILRPSTGARLVLRPQARAAWQPAATVAAYQVELWAQEVDPDTGAWLGVARLLGLFPAVGEIKVPYTPDTDRPLTLFVNEVAADGTRAHSELREMTQVSVNFKRETEAPQIGQNAPATADTVEIGITGHTRFARKRCVTISANQDMSDPLAVQTFDSADYIERELPRYFTLTREFTGRITTEGGDTLTTEDGAALVTEAGDVLPVTVYVTVAHSSGGAWTPESDVLAITFAGGDGTSGSDGDFDPTPRDKYQFDSFLGRHRP